MNENTPAIDINTTFLTVFFDPPELLEEASDVDGPSAGFTGVLPPGVVVPEAEGGGGGAGGDAKVGGDNGEAIGALTVELNGFPSFLKAGMANNFSGIGPEKRLFSTFKSLSGRSCKTSSVPEKLLLCKRRVVTDDKLWKDGGSSPLRLLLEKSKFISPVSGPNESGSSPLKRLPLRDRAASRVKDDNESGMLPVN